MCDSALCLGSPPVLPTLFGRLQVSHDCESHSPMPHYQVLVAGEGLWMCWEGRTQHCGFRVRCHVWATDPAVAANMAAQIVRSAPELVGATSGPVTKNVPVYIEEIDEATSEERREAVSRFHFFPLEGGDPRPHSILEQ